jgi:hypothetical protein
MDVTNRATRFPEATSLEPITLVTTMGMQRMDRKGATGLGPVPRDIVKRAVGFASCCRGKEANGSVDVDDEAAENMKRNQ